MYSENHIVNEIVLLCINDGNGSQCGYTYQARCDVARLTYYYHFLQMVRTARRWMLAHGVPLTQAENTQADRHNTEIDAVSILHQYYIDHISEMKGKKNVA